MPSVSISITQSGPPPAESGITSPGPHLQRIFFNMRGALESSKRCYITLKQATLPPTAFTIAMWSIHIIGFHNVLS